MMNLFRKIPSSQLYSNASHVAVTSVRQTSPLFHLGLDSVGPGPDAKHITQRVLSQWLGKTLDRTGEKSNQSIFFLCWKSHFPCCRLLPGVLMENKRSVFIQLNTRTLRVWHSPAVLRHIANIFDKFSLAPSICHFGRLVIEISIRSIFHHVIDLLSSPIHSFISESARTNKNIAYEFRLSTARPDFSVKHFLSAENHCHFIQAKRTVRPLALQIYHRFSFWFKSKNMELISIWMSRCESVNVPRGKRM